MGKDKKHERPQPKSIKIKRRTKKDTITVEGFLGYLTPELNNVKLTVTAATSEDWKKLEEYILENAEWFGLQFYSFFVNPAILKQSNKKLPRGFHKHTHAIVSELKIKAGILYVFFSYWCKKQSKEWPEYLKKLLGMAKYEGYDTYIKTTKGNYDAKGLTEYCLRKVYDRCIQQYNEKVPLSVLASALEKHEKEQKQQNKLIPAFKDYSSALEYAINKIKAGDITLKYKISPFKEDPYIFYITYIHEGKKVIGKRFYKKFIENKTPEEIVNLVYTAPILKSIFKALEII